MNPITFYFTDNAKKPIFDDVELNQFYVDIDGYLRQKVGTGRATYIADANGAPWGRGDEAVDTEEEVLRILPRVTKIEF